MEHNSGILQQKETFVEEDQERCNQQVEREILEIINKQADRKRVLDSPAEGTEGCEASQACPH